MSSSTSAQIINVVHMWFSIFWTIFTYLNLKHSKLSNHKLNLKVGTPVMLLKNIDHSRGMCENILSMAKILTKNSYGQKILISKILLTPSYMCLSFMFKRQKFPLIISYAMTINKNQGHSLSYVGLFLKNSIFSHDQFYVVVLRSRGGLKY